MMYRTVRRRRRTAETNYPKRVKQLKGGIPRLVVRKSNRGVLVQVVLYEENGDKVAASANSRELRKMGWEPRCNVPTAYLTGLLLAKKWKGEANLDIGLYKPVKGSVVFAAAKGAQDGGLKLGANLEIDEARLSGGHIEAYSKSVPARFGGYSKAGFDPASIKAKFEEAKASIMK
ncbi:MAG: 50S ribosomal protein L18 [Candidatus Micrarchaeota archaeon]|nr:50S ribosomal protein L18 [Candidatus Micrarchaeota archaeon]